MLQFCGCEAVFMPQQKTTEKNTALDLSAVALLDAYTDFILSRQAARRSENTIKFYQFTAGLFVQWLQGQAVGSPAELSARHVRAYLADLAGRGKSDGTIADHARGIRVMVRFWQSEGYLPAPVVFQIPKVAKKRLPTLDADTLARVISACDNPRDRALIMLMADSGLRRAEVIALNWGDVDMSSGLVMVHHGKGDKARSAVIGANTRRALLAYRRRHSKLEQRDPLFQTKQGGRFTADGFKQVFYKLRKRSGVNVTPHAMRRTFAILSLRAGMDPLHLQALGGWEGLEMVKHYAQLIDDDLLRSHKAHSPIDNLPRLRKK
jgi:integrase/recombinase XerD